MDEAVICLEEQLEAKSKPKSVGDKLKKMVPDMKSLNLLGRSGDPGSASASGTSTPQISIEASEPTLNAGSSDFRIAGDESDSPDRDDLNDEEHVVEIRECPICHQPRLNKRSDTDIITHIATCASQDWRQVNNVLVSGFVTASQAQRKWYSKVITKISYGGYKLGANSANILVQDRITGQINEEKMSVYVRLGIRMLYKGLKSREMENKRIRKMLKNLSIKQGKKFDDPASREEIEKFIEFHRLNMDEVLLPLNEFNNFNEFFYRALKPGARPCSAPDNSKIIVSPADCRSVVFNEMSQATSVWVKGREFNMKRLLGDAYPEDVSRFDGGSLGIFRLAPQDYHRFHMPVDGIMGEPRTIEGEYYTVNPMAIRSALDVYGENVRVLVPIDSEQHGRVMVICVGAMMVGSTVITATAGQQVKRTDELGYFKFGGSTILLLFEPGKMLYDDDLVDNSSSALETLVRVGMSVGHSPDEPQWTPDMRKDEQEVTDAEKKEAKRRIQGSAAVEDSPEGSGEDEPRHSRKPSAAPTVNTLAASAM
uniref:Phosphatidylserine decarboxylase proenzyme 2 n=1 Tax=Bionectria ochroleuca TaxID=29856 RepID=A0A8H7K7V8_BIOOC